MVISRAASMGSIYILVFLCKLLLKDFKRKTKIVFN